MTDPNNQQPTCSKNKGSPTIHSAKQSYPYSSKFAANLAPRQKQLEKLICEANSGKGKESRARLPQTRPDQSGARRRMGEEERLDWSVWLESGNFGRRRERVPALYHGDGAVQPLDLDTRCYGVRRLDLPVRVVGLRSFVGRERD